MPVTLNSTGISFSDGNTQNTAASAGAGINGTNITTYNSSGSASFPSNATAAVIVAGGGGGGFKGWNGLHRGGPGATTFGVFPRTLIGSNFSFNVGSGGNGTTRATTTPGQPGGTTEITNHIRAFGGTGGQQSFGTAPTPNSFDVIFGHGGSAPTLREPYRGTGGQANNPFASTPGQPGKLGIAFIG